MIKKIQSIHLYQFHACLNKLTCCLVQNMIKHYLRSQMCLNFESLVQNSSNPSGCSCIRPTHSYCLVISMHHIVHCIDCVSFSVAGNCPLSIDAFQQCDQWHQWRTILSSEVPGKQNPLFIPIQSHSLAPALFYCIRTTTIQVLHAAVVEPLILCMTCHCHSK